MGNFFMPYIFYKAGGSVASARVTSPEPVSISHWQYKDKDYNLDYQILDEVF